MANDAYDRIRNNPKFEKLVSTRNSYAWILTIMMFVAYYGFIALVAFNKELLSKPLGTGVMTVGIPVGVGVILFTIIITGIYVRRANTEFDAVTEEIIKEAK